MVVAEHAARGSFAATQPEVERTHRLAPCSYAFTFPDVPFRYATDLVPNIDDLPGRTRAAFPEIADERFWKFYNIASRYSLVQVTGFFNVFQTMNYIAQSRLPGDFVECGCFLGGVGIFMALMRDHLGMHEHRIVLFDTFDGFPDGSSDVFMGEPQKGIQVENFLKSVSENFASTVPTMNGIELVAGPIERTAREYPMGAISLLRLDTDFYSSTRAELEAFYPKLVRGGALIVDDYGMFEGARRATDEYLANLDAPPLLNRIDVGIWAGAKP